METPISKTEFESHKSSCGKSFDSINDQLALLNSAMFGERELKRKGVYEMTTEMYEKVVTAKGGRAILTLFLTGAGGITIVTGAFWALVEVFKRIKIN